MAAIADAYVTATVAGSSQSVTQGDAAAATIPPQLLTLTLTTPPGGTGTGQAGSANPPPMDLNGTTVAVRLLDPRSFGQVVPGAKYRLVLEYAGN